MPWKIQKDDDKFCVHKENADGSIGERVTCHGSEGEAEAHMRALYANVEETADTPVEENVTETVETPADEVITQTQSTNGSQPEAVDEHISETMMTTTMSREGRPAIPFAPGLTVDDFTGENGEKPTFVELKIAEIGKVSQQNYIYDEPLVNAIEQQIMQKRPGGIFGHPKPDEADTAFPDPDVHWVGAVRQGNTLWGKAWVRQMAAARRVQDTKRVGGSLTTSIWGKAKKVLNDGMIQLKDFRLERVDFAPMERAAAPMDGHFEVVYQMVDGREANVTVEEIKAALANLSPEVVTNILPKPVVEHISEMGANRADRQMQADVLQNVSQLTTDLNSAQQTIAEMTGQIKERDGQIVQLKNDLFQHDLDATVNWATDWNVATEPGKARLKGLRAVLRTGLVQEMKAGEPLKEAMLRVMENDVYKGIVEMTKNALGGGALVGQQNDNRAPAEVARPTEDQVKDAQARTGIR